MGAGRVPASMRKSRMSPGAKGRIVKRCIVLSLLGVGMLPYATEVYGDRLGEEQSIGYYTPYRRWFSWAQLGSAWMNDCQSIRR